MINPILNTIIKAKKGHYCHAIEVTFVTELDNLCEVIASEFSHYSNAVIVDFLESMSIYYLGECNETETEVYSYNFFNQINMI